MGPPLLLLTSGLPQTARSGRLHGRVGLVICVVLSLLASQNSCAANSVEGPTPHSHAHADEPASGHTDGHGDHAHPSGIAAKPWQTLAGYSVLIAAASLLGGWLPGRVRLSHVQFQLLLSVIGGMLLGIAIFHLFTHAVHELGSAKIDTIALWLMAGVVVMFFLLRVCHVHHHEPAAALPDGPDLPDVPGTQASPLPLDLHHEHCSHEAHHHAGHLPQAKHACGNGHGHAHGDSPGSRLGWTGMFFGLAIHTLLDGIALGASMQADALHGVGPLVGLGVFAGIALHKPLDSLSISTLMVASKRSWKERLAANLVYCLLCPLGAAAFLIGIPSGGEMSLVVGCGLAFSAGIFLCIALADLLPEMEFHSHHRWQLSACLMAGIVLAWALKFLEPAHLHP